MNPYCRWIAQTVPCPSAKLTEKIHLQVFLNCWQTPSLTFLFSFLPCSPRVQVSPWPQDCCSMGLPGEFGCWWAGEGTIREHDLSRGRCFPSGGAWNIFCAEKETWHKAFFLLLPLFWVPLAHHWSYRWTSFHCTANSSISRLEITQPDISKPKLWQG